MKKSPKQMKIQPTGITTHRKQMIIKVMEIKIHKNKQKNQQTKTQTI